VLSHHGAGSIWHSMTSKDVVEYLKTTRKTPNPTQRDIVLAIADQVRLHTYAYVYAYSNTCLCTHTYHVYIEICCTSYMFSHKLLAALSNNARCVGLLVCAGR